MNSFHSDRNFAKFLLALIWITHTLPPCNSSTRPFEGLKFGDVSCNYSGITVDLFSEESFEGVVYAQGNFFNPPCRYDATLESMGRIISLFLPLTDCGTLIQETHEAVYISNTIIVQKHPVVETVFDDVHNISCKLPHPANFDVDEIWKHKNHSNPYTNSVFESWLEFQLGSNILGKDISNKLLVGDNFLMAIHLKDGGLNKGMQVESCWAYDGETVKDSEYILHIYDRNKCEPSEWMSEFNLTQGKDTSDRMIYAVAKAFKFPKTKNVHITCSVQVCSNDCWDYCKIPEYDRSNAYPMRYKRSTLSNSSNKSLRERYRLMKATVKALGSKLIETNKAQRSLNNSDFHRRASSTATTTQNYEVIASEENDYYDKQNSSSWNNTTTARSNDFSDDYGDEFDYFRDDVYIFNLTNNIVVVTGHNFNFRYDDVSSRPFPNCVSKLRYALVMSSLCFILFCLLSVCICLALYLRKEKKKHQMNNFLLYNFY